jgi:hypothetical protein
LTFASTTHITREDDDEGTYVQDEELVPLNIVGDWRTSLEGKLLYGEVPDTPVDDMAYCTIQRERQRERVAISVTASPAPSHAIAIVRAVKRP